MLRVRISLNKRLDGFSYMFTGPYWYMLRVSSLQRLCASLVTQAAQEKRKRGFSLLLTDIKAHPCVWRSIGPATPPLHRPVCSWKNERWSNTFHTLRLFLGSIYRNFRRKVSTYLEFLERPPAAEWCLFSFCSNWKKVRHNPAVWCCTYLTT